MDQVLYPERGAYVQGIITPQNRGVVHVKQFALKFKSLFD